MMNEILTLTKNIINWCNLNQGFAMILLTLIYVIATIVICIFNYKSAKATNEQTKENKRQFNENNRAFVTITMDIIKSGLVVLKIQNNGNKIAKNVKIKINEKFMSGLNDELAISSLKKLQESSFIVGIQQKWEVYITITAEISSIVKELLCINLEYEDDKNSYNENITIDFNQYNWLLLTKSNEIEIRDILNKQTKAIEKIANNIKCQEENNAK